MIKIYINLFLDFRKFVDFSIKYGQTWYRDSFNNVAQPIFLKCDKVSAQTEEPGPESYNILYNL